MLDVRVEEEERRNGREWAEDGRLQAHISHMQALQAPSGGRMRQHRVRERERERERGDERREEILHGSHHFHDSFSRRSLSS